MNNSCEVRWFNNKFFLSPTSSSPGNTGGRLVTKVRVKARIENFWISFAWRLLWDEKNIKHFKIKVLYKKMYCISDCPSLCNYLLLATALYTFVLSELLIFVLDIWRVNVECPKWHFVLFALLKWLEGGQVCLCVVYCYDIINWQD